MAVHHKMWWLHQRVCRQIRERVRRQVESWPQAKPAFLEEPTHSKLIFDHEKMHKWVNIQIMVKLVSEKTIWSRCDDLHCQQLSYNVLKKEKDTVLPKTKWTLQGDASTRRSSETAANSDPIGAIQKATSDIWYIHYIGYTRIFGKGADCLYLKL